MPLDFPTSPTNGQAYQGYVYSTTIGAWQAKPSAQSPFYTSDTPPSNPVTGDSWFNTNDGTMYIYVYDGNTFQWVEHRSEIARSQVGLVPIKPTSVTVGSGTASVDVSGAITFTSCNYFDIINAFSSSYSTYKIIFERVNSAGIDYALQYVLVNSGGSANGSNFSNQRIYAQGTSFGSSRSTGNNFGTLGYITDSTCSSEMTIYRPAQSLYTTSQVQTSFIRLEGAPYVPNIEQWHSNLADTAQYTSIRFYSPSGNISGKVKIYGYN